MEKILILVIATITVFFAQDVQEKQKFTDVQMGNILRILSDKQVVGDIEPTKDQRAETKEILDARQKELKRIGDLAKEMTLPHEQIIEKVKQSDKECFEKIFYDVLLPHQRDRVLQLVARQELNSVSGSFSIYLSRKVGEELGVTKVQKEKLSEIRKEKLKLLYEEARVFRDKINKIVADEKDECLDVMTAKQKESLDKILGDKYSGKGFNFWAASIVRNFMMEQRDAEPDSTQERESASKAPRDGNR